MKLVFGVTVSDELEELQRLIPYLQEHKIKDSEIVVLADNLTVTKEVLDYLDIKGVPHYAKNLNNNFGEFKTALNVICKDLHKADYIFQIDADEIPSYVLVKNIYMIIEWNPDVDVFFVPRKNRVDGITDELLKEWKWAFNPKTHLINYPDYQGRIYKSHLKWVGKVHERLDMETYVWLPKDDDLYLMHDKKIEKQIKQNNFYKNINDGDDTFI